MVELLRTDATHPDFAELVKYLDADLAIRDGDEHSFYAQYNKTDHIHTVVVAFEDGKPVACGAFKPFDGRSVEIKRMYTLAEHRGRGFAQKVLAELENWAREMQYESCVLETGKKQPEAIALYQRCGYQLIENYGPYAGVENSVCFQKRL